MATLFNNNNADAGFRLQYLEVFNWGTFNGKVYKLKTNGKTSLLTGANGSGKTTLIDALLTLLVPSNKRFYNQSSGAEIKKERDEASYFWGHFGKTFSEVDEKSKIEQLRNKSDNPYSVLLANFHNAGTLHSITLVQIRWYAGGEIKKIFIVSPHSLNINEHFGKGNFDTKGDWKKKLVKQYPKTDLFNSFKEYAVRFSDLFGLKEKALSLFNQTVGIKVLGDLTQFVRREMLEEPNAEEQFKNLHDNFSDLLISHNAIKKDEKQLELLNPIIENKTKLATIKIKVNDFEQIQNNALLYFNKIEFELLEILISKLEEEIKKTEESKLIIDNKIKKQNVEKEQLITAKASLNIDAQLQSLEKDKQSEDRDKNVKQKHYNDYVNLATKLGLNTTIAENSFNDNTNKIKIIYKDIEQKFEELSLNQFRLRSNKDNNKVKLEDLQSSINSYLARKNRIPEDLIKVRERLLNLLEITEVELPFVGELIKVKESALKWEDSIEKVLHSFSLQLLVPEKYGKQVNEFVHNNNLYTKLVYQKIDKRDGESLIRMPNDNEYLINKVELKDENIYSKWVKNQLLERFNYYYTDDLNVFYNSEKAFTSNGLIRNKNRHEKDDRPNKWNKIRYTLGWDSKETVKLLQQEKYDVEKEQASLFEKLQDLTKQLKEIEDTKPLVTLIAHINSYNEINWQQHVIKIETISKQIIDLQKSNDKYATIKKQLEQLELLIEADNKSNEDFIRKLTTLSNDYNSANKRKLELSFEDLNEDTIDLILKFIDTEKLQNSKPESLNKLNDLKNELSNILKIQTNKVKKEEASLREDTISCINAFVHPSEIILKEFSEWTGDVMNISASITSLDELEDLYKNIQGQRLVEHKRRFKDYMDKSMLDSLTNYRTWLNNEEEKITEIIEELNIPLKKITFNKNPNTYLQLECKRTKEIDIRNFKEQLNEAIPNALQLNTQKDDNYREEVFNKIKKLITELQNEETYRRKVTDIRNWLTFGAREYNFLDNEKGQYHDNTASYSGGQKAQFTYAILGAAIAHQFGIFQHGKQYKSFRFITVDEAFSKLDPDKSQFLMEFCEQLNLQILVVTPLDKINIAEPYINAVHFVEIKNKKDSIVYNLTMDEYNERKEEFNNLIENEG